MTAMSNNSEESVKEEVFKTFEAMVRVKMIFAALVSPDLDLDKDTDELFKESPGVVKTIMLKQAIKFCPEMFHSLIDHAFEEGKKFKKE